MFKNGLAILLLTFLGLNANEVNSPFNNLKRGDALFSKSSPSKSRSEISMEFTGTETVIMGNIKVDGVPLINKTVTLRLITVNITNRDEDLRFAEIVTDEVGNFSSTILNLQSGEYYCLVTGKSFSPIWLGGEYLEDDHEPINLVDTVKNLTVNAKKAGVISGKVIEGLHEDILCSFNIISAVTGFKFGYEDSNINPDSTFTYSGLPAGDYYVSVKNSSSYELGYYPKSATFEDAIKVTVTVGDTTKIETSVIQKPKYDKALVNISVLESDGTPVDIDMITCYYSSGSTRSAGRTFDGTGAYSMDVYAGRPFKLQVIVKDSFLVKEYWNSGAETTLSANEEVNWDIVVKSAGSVSGEFIDKDSVDKIHSSSLENMFDFGYTLILENSDSKIVGNAEYPVSGDYTMAHAPEGDYKLSMIPYSECPKLENYTTQVYGAAAIIDESISIINDSSITKKIDSKFVSGMISGSYSSSKVSGLSGYYAVRPDGRVVSAGFFYFDTYLEDLYHGIYSYDWSVFKEINSEPATIPLDFPLLAAGDYYLIFVDSDNFSSVGKFLWYGQDQPTELANIWSFGQETYTIPTDAKKVTLDTDSSWVKGINFNNPTAISKRVKQTKRVNARVSTQSGKLNLTYNFSTPTANLSIYSLSGRLLTTRSLDVKKTSISWSPNLATGSYIVEVKAGAKKVLQKILLY
jgi:hypothetical protein